MAAPIELTNGERDEIILFLRSETFPDRITTRLQRQHFTRRARKFKYFENNMEFVFIKSIDVYLKFFTSDDEQGKRRYILNFHTQNGHPGRDKLYDSIKEIAYGV